MITFETPEGNVTELTEQLELVDEPEIMITISGKAINRISNLEIYFQEKKDET